MADSLRNREKGGGENGISEERSQEYQNGLSLMRKFTGVVDRKGRLQFANEAPVKGLGYAEEDILRKPFWDAGWFSQSAESQDMIKQGVLGALEGESTQCQVEAFTKAGISIPVTFTISPLKGKDADIVSIVAETEALVDEEAGQLRVISERVSSIPDFIRGRYFAVDSGDKLVAIGAIGAELLKYSSPDDMIGKRMANYWASLEDRDRFLIELSRKGELQNYQAVFMRSDGQAVQVEIDSRLLFNDEGEVIGSEGVVRDITDRKNLENVFWEAYAWSERTRSEIESDLNDRAGQLEDLKKRYMPLIEEASDGIAVLQGGILKFANFALALMLEREPEELLGAEFIQLMSPDSAELEKKRYKQGLVRKDAPGISEVDIVAKGGQMLPVELSSAVIEYDGKPAELIFLRDVSQRKLVERALCESEVHYRQIVENMTDVLWTADLNLQPIYVSPSIARQGGYAPEEALTLTPEVILSPESLEVAKTVLAERLVKDDTEQKDLAWPQAVELEFVANSGSTFWVEATVAFLRGPDGQPVGILGVMRDLTNRSQMNKNLQQREGHFQALVENSSDAFTILNSEGIILYGSPSVERIVGYKPEALVGMSLFSLVYPDDVTNVTSDLAALVDKVGGDGSWEMRLRHVDGSWHWMEWIAKNLISNPAVGGIVVSYRDITEHKLADETLQRNLEFEKMVSTLSSRFVNESDIDEAINGSLADVGRFSDASRVRVLLYSDNKTTVSNTHEWCAEGVSSEKDNIQNLSSRVLMWCRSGLESSPCLEIEDVSHMPSEAKREKKLLKSQGVKSLVVLPLTIGDAFIGFIDFENVEETGRWSAEVLPMLHIYSEIVGNAIGRTRAEEALCKDGERYRLIVENTGDVIILTQPNGVVSYVSPACQDVFGYDPGDLVGTQLQVAHSDYADQVRKVYSQAIEGRRCSDLEYRIVTKQGKAKWVSQSWVPVLRDGELQLVVSVARDATKRKGTEEAVRRRGRYFQTLIEQSSEGLMVLNPDMTVRYASAFVRDMPVCGENEVVGIPGFDFLHPDDAPRVMDAISDGIKNPRKPMIVESRVCARDGSLRHVEITGTDLLDNPDIRGFVLNVNDVTERKIAEEAACECEQEYLSLVELSSDGIVLTKDGEIIFANNRASEMFGSECEFAGKNLMELLSENLWEPVGEMSEAEREMVRARLAEENGSVITSYRDEVPVRNKSGVIQWIEINAHPIQLKGDIGGVVFLRDGTERKQAEAEAMKFEEKLQCLMENISLSQERVAVPIVEVWNQILALPLIGSIDAERTNQLIDGLTNKIVDSRAELVILDVTEITSMDTQATEHLLKVVESANLLGANCVVTGIKMGAAQMMIQLGGTEMENLITTRNMQEALRLGLRSVGYEVVKPMRPYAL